MVVVRSHWKFASATTWIARLFCSVVLGLLWGTHYSYVNSPNVKQRKDRCNQEQNPCMDFGRYIVYNEFVSWIYMEPVQMPQSKKCHLYLYPRKEGKIIPKELQAAEHGRRPGFQTKSVLLSVGTRQVLFLFAKPLISTWMLFVINTLRFQDAAHP